MDERAREASRNAATTPGDVLTVLRALREIVRSGQELGDDAHEIVRETLVHIAAGDRNLIHGRAGKAPPIAGPERLSDEEIASRLRIPPERLIQLKNCPGAPFVRSGDVMQALDSVFGVGGWSVTIDDVRIIERPEFLNNGRWSHATAAATVTVRALDASLQASAVAASPGRGFTSFDVPVDMAVRQASVSAFKRAAAMLGARALPLEAT